MRTKNLVFLGCLVLCVGGWWGYRQWAFSSREVFYNVCEFSRAYHHYIRANSGNLPTNLNALIEAEYLEEVEPGIYVGPKSESPEIISNFEGKRLEYADALSFRFGGKLDDFEVTDGKVIDKQTKEEVIFVRPNRDYLVEFGRRFTIRIVEDFLKNQSGR
ncbi:MAG TPA: hypothetical protein PKN33_09190 [Phycisphaerae bacterium]|nr:hypothetical protein [Phycisphaerae bacterium]